MSRLATTHRFPASAIVRRHGRCHAAHARRACPPGSEIPRRIDVGVNLVTTPFAAEDGLLGPIAPLRMSAPAATLARMPWIFLNDLDTGQCRLVADEAQQLRERPTGDHPIDL